MDIKQISRVCGTFRARYKGVLIQSGLTRFLLIILAIGVGSAFFDWMFHFGTFVRFTILLAAVAGGCLMFWWTSILAMKRTWSDTQVLAYLDTTEDVNNRGILELYELIKAENIQETNSEIGKNFLTEAVKELNDRLGRISYGKAVRKSSFLKWFYALAAVIAVIAVGFVLDAEKARTGAIRYLNPFTDLDWPSRTKVVIYPPMEYTVTVKTKDKSQEYKFDNVKEKSFDITCGSETTSSVVINDKLSAAKQFKIGITLEKLFVEDLGGEFETKLSGTKVVGKVEYLPEKVITVGASEITLTQKIKVPWSIPQLESVKVNALVTGEIPSQATLIYKSNGFEIKEKINVSKNGNLEYEFPSVKEELTFYIIAGDYETRKQTISVIQRPFLKKITADYKFPPYAGVPNKKVESGQLTGIEGTEVTVTFESSMELSKAVFNLEGVGKEDLKQVNGTTYTKTILLEKNGAYNIELYEKSGFRESKPERFEIKVDPDAKPEIEILAPGRNLSETKNASIEISFKVSDDFGIKTLGVYYKINDAAEYKLLSDKITGKIAVGGKKSEVKFDWDFKKMDVPESTIIKYYIKAQDVNPTGNGVTQSPEYEIELIKPSVFHQEAILKAKVLITEGMIAWKNSLDAYNESRAWLPKAENKVDDAVWNSMVDKQEAAIRAVDAMNSQLAILTDKYERNRMQKEFMSVRLNSVITDIKNMTTKEMSITQEKIRGAKPKNDAEAGKVKELRTAAYAAFEVHQKMSVLYMERILKKLFDWRDLQDCTIKTTNIFERQTDILAKTVELAPRLIGKEFLDLSDEDQTALTDLGKQQKSIYEAEDSMEKLLEYLMARAKINKRKSIQVPLDVAFKYLRTKRVNDTLKKIDQLIGNNQCSMVTGDQKNVADVMNVVKGGLVKAGMEVEPDQPLSGEIAPPTDLEDPKEDPKEKDKPPVVATTVDTPEPEGEAKDETPEKALEKLIVGDDALSTAILFTIDIEEKIRARLKYLAGLKDPKVMPRLKKLKIRRMEELQTGAGDVIKKAIEIADKDKKEFVSKELKRTQAHFVESNKLIAAKDTSETHQLFIEACNAHMNNLILLIAKEKDINGIVEEHTRQKGKDSFGRDFLAQEADLKLLSESSIELFKTYIYQSHINSGVSRFAKNPAESAEMKALEATIRKTIAALEGEVKTAIEAEKAKAEKLTEPVKVKYKAYDGYKAFAVDLGKTAEAIGAGKDDAATTAETKAFNNDLAGFISSLKDLMEERVKVIEKPVEVIEVVIDAKAFEDGKKAANILVLIEKSNLPADQKEILRRTLSSDFKGKYKDLLSAYFRTIAEEQGATK